MALEGTLVLALVAGQIPAMAGTSNTVQGPGAGPGPPRWGQQGHLPCRLWSVWASPAARVEGERTVAPAWTVEYHTV